MGLLVQEWDLLKKIYLYVQSKSNSNKYSTGEQTQTQHHGPKNKEVEIRENYECAKLLC